jgi:hypothetical protein
MAAATTVTSSQRARQARRRAALAAAVLAVVAVLAGVAVLAVVAGVVVAGVVVAVCCAVVEGFGVVVGVVDGDGVVVVVDDVAGGGVAEGCAGGAVAEVAVARVGSAGSSVAIVTSYRMIDRNDHTWGTGFATWFTRVFPEEREVSVARGRLPTYVRGTSCCYQAGVRGSELLIYFPLLFDVQQPRSFCAQQVRLANTCIYDIGAAYLMLSVMDAVAKETRPW